MYPICFVVHLQIDSSVCSNTEHQAFQSVFTTFTTLIVDMSLPLDLKVSMAYAKVQTSIG